VAAGCGTGKPYQTVFNTPLLALREPGDISQNGVTIGIAPVTRATAQNYPIGKTVEWRQPDPGDPSLTRPDRRAIGQTVVRAGTIYLLPLPSFYLGIRNQTGAPLDLSQVQFEVFDDQQRRYVMIRNTADIKARFFADTTGSDPYIAGDRATMDRLMNAIDELALLTPAVVIPDGQLWAGYLALNSDSHSAHDYYALMNSTHSFTVRLKDVPTRGGKRSEFTFVMDKSNQTVSLTCPGAVREPDPEQCRVNPSRETP
jgi:hypothetical protein